MNFHDPVAVMPIEPGSSAQAVGADVSELKMVTGLQGLGQINFAWQYI
ncbi:hypothetical protein ACFL07_03805 [Pseudomonadota bacterium]